MENTNVGNTPPGVQTADNPNKVSTFEDTYKKLTELVNNKKNSLSNSERSYRIAGIIDLNTGATRDMIYQVDLGEAEKVAKRDRNQDFYKTYSAFTAPNKDDVPDYSALANPVVMEKKVTPLSLMSDNLASIGKYIHDFFNSGDKTKYYNMRKNIEDKYPRSVAMTDTEYIDTLPEEKQADYVFARYMLNFNDKPDAQKHIEILKKKANDYVAEQDKNRQYKPMFPELHKFNTGASQNSNNEASQNSNNEASENSNNEASENINTGGRRHKSRRSNKTKNRKFYSNKTKRSNKRSNKTRKSKA